MERHWQSSEWAQLLVAGLRALVGELRPLATEDSEALRCSVSCVGDWPGAGLVPSLQARWLAGRRAPVWQRDVAAMACGGMWVV